MKKINGLGWVTIDGDGRLRKENAMVLRCMELRCSFLRFSMVQIASEKLEVTQLA